MLPGKRTKHVRAAQAAELEEQLRSLRASSDGVPVSQFGGASTERLHAALRQPGELRRFRRPPIGPVGLYVRVSDQRCARAAVPPALPQPPFLISLCSPPRGACHLAAQGA